MATLLFRLGRFAYRRPWRVLAAWLLIAIAVLGGGFALGGKTVDSFAIPGTESQQAIDRLDAVFPSASGGSAQVVYRAPDGQSVRDEANTAAIESIVDRAGDIDGVKGVTSPFNKFASQAISSDDSTALINVQFTTESSEVTDATLAGLLAVEAADQPAGAEVAFAGQVFQNVSPGITPTEVVGVLFAGLVLFITFGSLLAAGLPLFTAILGIAVSLGGVIAVSAFTTISSSTPLLALMIGLAVGIDYALFILSRHRGQLAQGMDPEESAATAVATAGSSVVFAGVTVMIALLGLIVVQIPFLSTMGISAAAAVLVAILVSVTLLPAVLGLAGRRLVPKPGSRAAKRASTDAAAPRSFGERWVRLVVRFPVVAVLAVIAVLGTVAIPAFSLQLALPTGAQEDKGTVARTGYDLISEGFGPGRNGPLVILTDLTQTNDPVGVLKKIAADLGKLPDVQSVSDGSPNATVDTGIQQVVPDSGPADPATTALVQRIREIAPTLEKKYDVELFVTGTTAVQIDISSRLNNALVPFGLVVVGLSIPLLMMVFRSIFVPIKAAVGFLLSVLTSFGVVVAVFQWGWFAETLHFVPGPILSFLPILLMAVLFGLAMDYEVFLVSGMREAWVHTGDARGSIIRGFSGAARVVTAAALIMFFVFAAFVPEGAGVIKAIALGLAVGILADAFLVRMTLVPAAMALVGRAAWWMPKWLQRILPNVDIEGEHLRENREAIAWAQAQRPDVLTADYLVAGVRGASVGPVSLSVEPGSLVFASGPAVDRSVLAATLSGRLTPLAGRAQVGGHPLPAESSRVQRLVALADIGGSERAEVRSTVAELLEERLRLTLPLGRAGTARRRSREWVERILAALDRPKSFSGASTVDSLTPLERAVVLAAVALAERTPVVMLNQLDSFAESDDEAAFIRAVDRLATSTTTVVIGTPLPPRALADHATTRPRTEIDLYRLDGPDDAPAAPDTIASVGPAAGKVSAS